MNTGRSHFKLVIAFFCGTTYFYSLRSLAQTPSPSVSPANLPQAVQPTIPANIEPRITVLETKIQSLENKINSLDTEEASPDLIPIILSGLTGGVLGSIFAALLLRKMAWGNASNRKGAKDELTQAEADSTTQYLKATITHLSTSLKNTSERLKDLEGQLANLRREQRTNAVDINPFQPGTPIDMEALGDELGGSPAAPKFVAAYNRDRDSLMIRGIEVAETEESMSNRQLSGSQLVVFETKRQGDYLIVKEKRIEYMIPKPSLHVDADNYPIVETIFECHNYSPGRTNFQLVQPARVVAILGGINWSLEQKGILEFH